MFTLVDEPFFHPGCSLLGNTIGPMVHTGIDINGMVYIDRVEAREVCRLMFGIDADQIAAQLEQLEQRAADAEKRVAELETEVAELAPVAAAVERAAQKWGGLEQDDEPVRPTGKRGRR